MKYCIVYQEGEQVTETYSEVEADSPQGALDQVECEGLDGSWQYEDDADGSGCYVDPQRSDRLYSARPLSYECAACGAEAPIDDIAAVPAPDDDAEWDRLSLHHYDQCEWIRTRGNQITV
jgi:hypothetical protein